MITTSAYRSPIDHSEVFLTDEGYVDRQGKIFPLKNQLPNFVYPDELPYDDMVSLEWYKNNADVYDKYLPLTFQTFNVSEDQERDKLINALHLSPNNRVLEIGAGTGRDSLKIASCLGKDGELFLSDISHDIFKHAVEKIQQGSFMPSIHLLLANGYHLPFGNAYFDRVFHFGGINTFGNVKRAFSEMVRVCKPGGRIVVGDENMPVWLRETEFGKVLMNSNHLYRDMIPFDCIPVEARNVKLEWIMGGVFYYLSFDVGSGEPYADIDFDIPGIRGGTHRTRYYGQLEGVSSEAVELAKEARKKSGKSMHAWLDDVIKAAAKKDLDE